MGHSTNSGNSPLRVNPKPRHARISDAEAAIALRRAQRVARLLDEQFRIPGTGYRIGYDAIVGLLPVVGDTLTLIVGLYPIIEGLRLGVRRRTVIRMLMNLGVDWLLGLIPVLDVVLDAAYKANMKNVRLLERELRGRSASL